MRNEVFRVLGAHRSPGLLFRMKMVGLDQVWVDRYFHAVSRKWTDSFNGPFEHRTVEWLEVRGERAPEVRREIERLGRVPIVTIDDGFRVQAYGLTSDE